MDNDTTSKRNRCGWIDAVKGVAVMLVMWGHVQPASPIRSWILTFHVPVFIVLTGYLYAAKGDQKENLLNRYKRTIKKNLIPYVICSVIALVIGVLFDLLIHNFSLINIAKGIYGIVTGYGGEYALWYIPSYLIGLGVYYLINTKVNNITVKWGLLVAPIFCAILWETKLQFVLMTLIPETYFWLLSYPLIVLIRSFTFIFYIEIGNRLYFFLCNETFWKYFVLIIAFFVNILISVINGDSNYSMLLHGKYPIILYLCGFLGSIGIIGVIKFIYKFFDLRLVEYLGKESLFIMLTHRNWKITMIASLLLNKLLWIKPTENSIELYLWGVICVGIMILMEICIIKIKVKCKQKRVR